MDLKIEKQLVSKSGENNPKTGLQIPEGLYFNVLPFEWPDETFRVSVSEKPGKHSIRFNSVKLPESITNSFRLQNGKTPEQLYIDFFSGGGGLIFGLKPSENELLAKNWLLWKLRNHLCPKFPWHKTNFIGDIQFWQEENTGPENYWKFQKFTLRIQTDGFTQKPELLISYDGVSYIAVRSEEELAEDGFSQARLIKSIAFRSQIYSSGKRPEQADYHQAEVFPVLHRELTSELGYSIPKEIVRNKVELFVQRIREFYNQWCSNEEFRQIIPHQRQWKAADANRTGCLDGPQMKMVFGNNGQHSNPYNGLMNFGPYSLPKNGFVNYFYIYFDTQEEFVERLEKYFRKNENSLNIYSFMKTRLNYTKNQNFKINSQENVIEQIRNFGKICSFQPNENWLAFYITPFSKTEENTGNQIIYYRIKEMMLHRGIPVQAIEQQNIKDNFKFFIAGIASACIAKTGGVPWIIPAATKRELVIGFSVKRKNGFGNNYIGSTVSFSEDGHFHEYGFLPEGDIHAIAGTASKAFLEFRSKFRDAEQMTIHFDKHIGKKELEPLEKMMKGLKLDIPVVIAGFIRDRGSSQLLLDQPSAKYMPADGTWALTRKGEYLLNLNLRKGDQISVNQTLPVKILLSCNKPGYLDSNNNAEKVIEKIYAFSKLHWRSVNQPPIPVTLYYAEMIASFIPHFNQSFLNKYAKNIPWFL